MNPEFLAEYQPLPAPGGYLTRRPTRPCGCCPATVFEVARCVREAKLEDGTTRRRETVDVQCPRCALLAARTVIEKEVIGTFDTATGELAIDAGVRP